LPWWTVRVLASTGLAKVMPAAGHRRCLADAGSPAAAGAGVAAGRAASNGPPPAPRHRGLGEQQGRDHHRGGEPPGQHHPIPQESAGVVFLHHEHSPPPPPAARPRRWFPLPARLRLPVLVRPQLRIPGPGGPAPASVPGYVCAGRLKVQAFRLPRAPAERKPTARLRARPPRIRMIKVAQRRQIPAW
jgi:hypothetical protein